MLPVVNLHGFLVEVWLKGIVAVTELWKDERHGGGCGGVEGGVTEAAR
jgi:hypothetical protein